MTEAYRVGVTFALKNLVSAELAQIATQFSATNKEAKALHSTMMTLATVGVMAAGYGAAEFLKSSLDEARKFQLETAKFASLGFGAQVTGEASEFARAMDTMGTSATENMALVTDAMAVFKSLPHAELAADLMAKMKFANGVLYGDQGGARDSKFMDMLKVIEFRGGLKSDEEFRTQADFVQKVIEGSRNRVDGTQLLNALKTGGVSLARLGNEAFYLGSEPLIQEFGGSRYGTANMSAYQNLINMRTTQQALSEMMRLGLLDKSKVEFNEFTGHVKRAQPGAFINGQVLTEQGDLAFLEQVLLPAFAKKGITSDEDVIMEIGKLFTNRTASSLFSRIYQQRHQLHTQLDANKNAMGIDAAQTTADATLDGKIIEFHKEWNDLLNAVGTIILPAATNALKIIIEALKPIVWLADQLRQHAYLMKFLPGGVGMLFGSSSPAGSPNAVPAPSQQQTIVVDHQTNLDGHAIAQSTTRYQIDGLAKMPAGGNNFDLRAAPYAPGY
jgi:hypothetical protein